MFHSTSREVNTKTSDDHYNLIFMLKGILLTLIFSFPIIVLAQSEEDEMSLIQSMYGMEKRKLVSDYMQVPQESASAFWNIYDQYEASRRELGRSRIKLLSEYVDNFASLTEEKADELSMALLNNNVQYQKLYKEYYKKFRKATSPLKAAQFMQMETFLENVIRSQIQEEIPFIGELKGLTNK